MTVANQNYIHEGIRSRLNSWNAHYHSVRNLFISPLKKTQKLSTMLSVVLYGCESWSVILSEVNKLNVFENWVLGRISGPKRWSNSMVQKKKNAKWGAFTLCPLHCKIKEDGMSEMCRTQGKMKNAYKIVVVKPKGWWLGHKDNIKMGLKKEEWVRTGFNWVTASSRLLRTQEPIGSIISSTFLEQLSDYQLSKSTLPQEFSDYTT